MLIHYNGPQSRYHHTNPSFVADKGVPTYIPWQIAANLPTTIFKEGLGPAVAGRPILVYMPNSLAEFVVALTLVIQLKDYYPTCPVEILCSTLFKPLLQFLPQRITAIHSLKSAAQVGDKYYRTFDLRPERNKLIYSKVMRTGNQLSYLLWHSFGVDLSERPKGYPWLLYSTPQGLRDRVSVLPYGRTHGTSRKDLADAFVNQGFQPIPQGDSPEILAEIVEQLKASLFVVAVGDSPYIPLALWLGCKVHAFLPSQNTTSERIDDIEWSAWRERGAYNWTALFNIVDGTGQALECEDVAKRIRSMVEKTYGFSSSTPTRNPEPSAAPPEADASAGLEEDSDSDPGRQFDHPDGRRGKRGTETGSEGEGQEIDRETDQDN